MVRRVLLNSILLFLHFLLFTLELNAKILFVVFKKFEDCQFEERFDTKLSFSLLIILYQDSKIIMTNYSPGIYELHMKLMVCNVIFVHVLC